MMGVSLGGSGVQKQLLDSEFSCISNLQKLKPSDEEHGVKYDKAFDS